MNHKHERHRTDCLTKGIFGKKIRRNIAVIPARHQASRFPGKLMALLGSKTVIRRTYEAAIGTQLFDEVLVVTGSEHIFKEISRHGGRALISKKKTDGHGSHRRDRRATTGGYHCKYSGR